MGSMKFGTPKGTITFNLSPSAIKFDPALLMVSPIKPYRITIACDGDTTTAKMIVNGKTVKTTTAKRNPADKANWRIGAQTAFDRLWQRKEKPEGQKQEGGFRVGDRVVVCNNRYHHSGAIGQHGRVVAFGTDHSRVLIGVELDDGIDIGHECSLYSYDRKPHAKTGHGLWFYPEELIHEIPTKPGRGKK